MSHVPDEIAIRTCAHICGLVDRDFRARVIRPGLVALSGRGKVTRVSLEHFLGHAITADRYLQADRQRDAAREWQRAYRANHKETADALA